jgi:hypothetical protein
MVMPQKTCKKRKDSGILLKPKKQTKERRSKPYEKHTTNPNPAIRLKMKAR